MKTQFERVVEGNNPSSLPDKEYHYIYQECTPVIGTMQSTPLVLVPGLLCSARLYAAQIAALCSQSHVTVADHRRDDTKEAIAARILRDAPPRFALAGLSMGGYIAFAMMRLA